MNGIRSKGTTWTVLATDVSCTYAMRQVPALLEQWQHAKPGARLSLAGATCIVSTDRASSGAGTSSRGFVCHKGSGAAAIFSPNTFAGREKDPLHGRADQGLLRARVARGSRCRLLLRQPPLRLRENARSRASEGGHDLTTFDDYLADLPGAQKAELERLRRRVHELVPEAEEGASYGMPAFKLDGRPLLGFRASRRHLSVFPFSATAVSGASPALAGLDLSKGTVRFTPEAPLPDPALEALLRARIGEIANT